MTYLLRTQTNIYKTKISDRQIGDFFIAILLSVFEKIKPHAWEVLPLKVFTCSIAGG